MTSKTSAAAPVLVLLIFLLVCTLSTVKASEPLSPEKTRLGEDETRKLYHTIIQDSGVEMGEIGIDDLPITGLKGEEALHLMFERYRARMKNHHEPRMFGMEDLNEKEIGELCGNSASLECGKKVLKYVSPDDDREKDILFDNQLTVYKKCTLRKEFLGCIDMQRKKCRKEADKGIYPRLPPKSMIRSTQSKIWRALWTSGGCTLIN